MDAGFGPQPMTTPAHDGISEPTRSSGGSATRSPSAHSTNTMSMVYAQNTLNAYSR